MKEITYEEFKQICLSNDFDLKCLLIIEDAYNINYPDNSFIEKKIFVNDMSRKKLHKLTCFIGKLVILNDDYKPDYTIMPYELSIYHYDNYDKFYLADNMAKAIKCIQYLDTLS